MNAPIQTCSCPAPCGESEFGFTICRDLGTRPAADQLSRLQLAEAADLRETADVETLCRYVGHDHDEDGPCEHPASRYADAACGLWGDAVPRDVADWLLARFGLCTCGAKRA